MADRMDVEAAFELINQQDERLKKLERSLETANEILVEHTRWWTLNSPLRVIREIFDPMRGVMWVGVLTLAAAVFAGGYSIYKAMTASGVVDYCTVRAIDTSNLDQEKRNDSARYRLTGHREWRENTVIGDFNIIDGAMTVAARLNCPVK